MIKCTDMTPILGLDEEGEVMDAPYSKLSATELIEASIAQDKQAMMTYELFRKLVNKGDRKNAERIYWHMWFNFGVDLAVETVDGII